MSIYTLNGQYRDFVEYVYKSPEFYGAHKDVYRGCVRRRESLKVFNDLTLFRAAGYALVTSSYFLDRSLGLWLNIKPLSRVSWRLNFAM